jgi:hypothetical protein
MTAQRLIRENSARDYPMTILVQHVAFGILEDPLGSLVPPNDMLICIHDVNAIARIAEHVKIFRFAHDKQLPDIYRIISKPTAKNSRSETQIAAIFAGILPCNACSCGPN